MNKSKIKTIIFATALAISISSVSLFTATNAFADVTQVTSQRLWGNDRYETAVAVSKSGFTTSDTVILVRGDNFADALAVTPLAKMYNAPILLTKVNSLPTSVKAEITRLGAKKVVIAGGIGAVSQAVEDSLKNLATVERISGSDRYATSVMIAEKLGAKTSIALVTGSDFADGESIAAVAAQVGMPVIFTQKNTLSATAKKYIANNKVTKTYVIGGNAVISDSVAAAVPGMERLSGVNRFDTNLAILNKFSNQIDFGGVYVATGADFADALTATALAAKNSGAVVLASKTLTAANVSFIQDQITPKTVVTLVGGEKIVPSAIATSLTLDKTDYATDGKTYAAADITGKNINLTGKNITVDGATINGNLYVYGNDTKLSNTTVNGTIFLDPGLTGDVTLKNVQASRIVVQSGADSSINLDSVTAAVLVSQSVNSNPSTRIHTTGITAIGATEIQSDIFLNCEAGSFGDVSVNAGGTSNRNLELAGTFAPIHLAAPCNFSGTATPIVSVDAPGVTISGNVGDLVINTTTAPQFAPGTVIKRIIGTAVSKGITLTIPAGVKVTQATSDFVLDGTGASSIVVIKPTTPSEDGGSSSSGGNGGNSGSNIPVSYSATFAGITKSGISDMKLNKFYDTYKSYISIIPALLTDAQRETANEAVEKLIDKMQTTTVSGDQSLMDYAISKDSTGKLVGYIEDYIDDNNETANLIAYFENKSFEYLFSTLTDKSHGDISIPTLSNSDQIAVTVTNLATKKTVTYDSAKPVDINEVQNTLSIDDNTLISELITKDFEVTIKHGSKLELKINANHGVFKITTPVNTVHTITVK